MSEIKKDCPYCFKKPLESCQMAPQVRDQVISGGLTEREWEDYVFTINENVLPECAFPNELKKAISEAKKLWNGLG